MFPSLCLGFAQDSYTLLLLDRDSIPASFCRAIVLTFTNASFIANTSPTRARLSRTITIKSAGDDGASSPLPFPTCIETWLSRDLSSNWSANRRLDCGKRFADTDFTPTNIVSLKQGRAMATWIDWLGRELLSFWRPKGT